MFHMKVVDVNGELGLCFICTLSPFGK